MKELSRQDDITGLLDSWTGGDPQALDDLAPLVYDRLRRLAGSFLRHERRDHTLQTTALIHEAFLRLVEQNRAEFHNRQEFFATTGKLMRRILVDHARARKGLKRGGGAEHLPAEVLDHSPAPARPPHLEDLDAALRELEVENPDLARIVELKFFVGLTVAEIAQVSQLGSATVQRRWRIARAWLHHRVVGETAVGLSNHDPVVPG
ncbi:MAG: sigma-70 family RNA polymerase sigma factor [Deltaproteobacteria bacterium]|nr:sigma-70 family RNA polymerase sigma factor [Deltaproteobacteria bacterium]